MSLSRDEIYDKVLEIISGQLNIQKDSIDQHSSLDSLGADSLDTVEIIMKLEEEFGIEINDQDAEKLGTLDKIINYIYDFKNKGS